MTDAPSTSTPVQADPASPSPVTRLNAKTARRQKLLLGSLGVVALVGGSWFILAATTARRATIPPPPRRSTRPGLVNRDLSQREFVATYGNRLDAVTREQKALKDASSRARK
jgi:conjugal transfer pilus assembly protein TraB